MPPSEIKLPQFMEEDVEGSLAKLENYWDQNAMYCPYAAQLSFVGECL